MAMNARRRRVVVAIVDTAYAMDVMDCGVVCRSVNECRARCVRDARMYIRWTNIMGACVNVMEGDMECRLGMNTLPDA